MAKKQASPSGAPPREPLVWLNSEVKSPPFTPEGRQEAGMLLRLLQEGERLGMPQSEPLTGLCPSCGCLRVRDAGANWRIMYRIDSDAVVVMEVYAKKTAAIPKGVFDRCKRRIKEYDETLRAAKKQ
ncbi:MAG: type II toxin-antitoxin system RelE/ParE family toxin [Lacipirellulaceae bacterium]